MVQGVATGANVIGGAFPAGERQAGPQGAGRLPALDVARGFTILAVVAFHGLQSGPVADAPGWAWHLCYTLGGIRMPLLLLVSGFLSAGILADRSRAVSRVANLAWLYLLWSLLSYPLEYHTVLRPPPGLGYALVAPENYVWFLAALALLTASLALLPRWGAALLGLGLAAWCMLASPASLGWHALAAYGPFFYLGALFPGAIRRALTAGPLAALILLAGFFAARLLTDGEVQCLVGGLLGCAAVLPLAGLLGRVPVLGAGATWLGRRTLPVYLAHTPVLIVLRLVMPAGLGWLVAAMPVAVLLPLAVYGARNRLRLRGAFEAPAPLAPLLADAWHGRAAASRPIDERHSIGR